MTNTNKGHFTCIQHTREGAISVTSFGCFDDTLVKWLQKWDNIVQMLFNLDIQMGEANILQMPLDIIQDKEGLEC